MKSLKNSILPFVAALALVLVPFSLSADNCASKESACEKQESACSEKSACKESKKGCEAKTDCGEKSSCASPCGAEVCKAKGCEHKDGDCVDCKCPEKSKRACCGSEACPDKGCGDKKAKKDKKDKKSKACCADAKEAA